MYIIASRQLFVDSSMGPKKKKKRNYGNEAEDISHWECRQSLSVYSDSINDTQRNEIFNSRSRQWNEAKDTFLQHYEEEIKRGRPNNNTEITKCLLHWLKFESWSLCKQCLAVSKGNLVPRCFNSRGCKTTNDCFCKSEKYVVPSLKDIPDPLRDLSKSERDVLRIFDIDIGPYQRQKYGSRTKTAAFELRYRKDTVVDRIQATVCIESRQRLNKAYSYLSQSDLSSYKDYLEIQSSPDEEGAKIKYWQLFTVTGKHSDMPLLECALWPVLYPFASWCEVQVS